MFTYPEKSIAEPYIGIKIITYGSTKWKDGYDRLFMWWDCPIYLGLSLIERKNDLSQGKSIGFNARTIHNAYHNHNELTIEKERVGSDGFIHNIAKRVKKSGPFYKMLWRCIRKNFLKNQPTLAAFLRRI
nr:hypothetical protein [Candidatus Prometheoarchaeum syntrophicum]